MTSLVTGGAGFIGSHVVNSLITHGHQLVVLDDLSGGDKENVNDEAKLIIGSITDSALVNQLFDQYNFTYVYHLAAYAAEGLSPFIRKFNYENNLMGSINLINAAINHEVKCFVFTSSIAVYGHGKLPMKESDQPKPVDPYGIAKYAVELDLKNAHDQFHLNYIVFRPHNVYGPYQNTGDKYRNVVGIFMNQILKDQPLTIFGDGEQRRAFSSIEDIAPYIADSVFNPSAYNSTFNIGGDQVYTINQLAEAVIKSMNSNIEIQYLDSRKEVTDVYSDHTLFNSIFEPSKKTSLELGISKMAEWVKKYGARSSNAFENIEIKKNIPSVWNEKL
ncbi:MAG: NAD-dependent epimerase/dehydratase family protein [Cyclobacteriaceae bacterium]|nr:NAD-dependent epimerase/dehydratase family protein [Cyclobacteriaceae bacterium]